MSCSHFWSSDCPVPTSDYHVPIVKFPLLLIWWWTAFVKCTRFTDIFQIFAKSCENFAEAEILWSLSLIVVVRSQFGKFGDVNIVHWTTKTKAIDNFQPILVSVFLFDPLSNLVKRKAVNHYQTSNFPEKISEIFFRKGFHCIEVFLKQSW